MNSNNKKIIRNLLIYLGIPIFDGITSLQSAVLIPLPEDGSGGTLPKDTQYFPETGYPEL